MFIILKVTATQNPAQQTIVVNESHANIRGNALTPKLEQQTKLIVNGVPINSNVKKELIQKVLAPNFQKKMKQQVIQSQNSESIIKSSLIGQHIKNDGDDEDDSDNDDLENKESFVLTPDYIQQSNCIKIFDYKICYNN